jgi:hypothetical protein
MSTFEVASGLRATADSVGNRHQPFAGVVAPPQENGHFISTACLVEMNIVPVNKSKFIAVNSDAGSSLNNFSAESRPSTTQ